MPVQYPEVFKINIIRRYESGEKIKEALIKAGKSQANRQR